MKNQLISKSLDIDSLQKLSKELFTSSLFDGKNPSQIFAKILAGKELGLEPIASITGINMIQGKPCLGANLIATLIARHPSYDYKVLRSDDNACEIEIFENKTSLGKCGFTIQEAQNAGLAGKDVWKKYPSDMLFARCITRAARRFAPGIFGGSPIYTPEELNVDMDEEGRIIEGEIVDEKPKPKLASFDQITYFNDLCSELNVTEEKIRKRLSDYKFNSLQEVTEPVMAKWTEDLLSRKESLALQQGAAA